jgi:predicted sulfurtransferase
MASAAAGATTTTTASDSSSLSSSCTNNCSSIIAPGVHLSPTEWNERLTALSLRQQQKIEQPVLLEDDSKNDPNNNNHNNNQQQKRQPMIVDCRNVYESSVGYFHVPNVPTLLVNTRKYSELCNVLMSQQEHLQNASEIFLYCTGGVRCERASLFLNAMLLTSSSLSPEEEEDQSNDNDNNNNDDEKSSSTSSSRARNCPKIYQLHGGIQRYLECTVGGGGGGGESVASAPPRPRSCPRPPLPAAASALTDNNALSKHPAETKKTTPTVVHHQNNAHDPQQDYDSNDELSQQRGQQQQTCYFKGKNFVFDQRRLDPVFYQPPQQDRNGNTDDQNNNSNSSGIVGKCLVCAKPHDDFDNGHAPAENKEARCWNCRILILVCNTCRPKVSCWENNYKKQQKDDSSDSNNSLPRMYCAGLEKPCFHKPPVKVILTKQECVQDKK